jgi:hypothetical protein
MPMIKMSKPEKDMVHRIHLLTGLSHEQVQSVFEGFLYATLMDYSNNESINFPFLGEITITYLKDTITKKGRVADLKVSFEPDSFLVRTIGQIEDGDVISDLEEYLQNEIKSILKKSFENVGEM